MNFLDGPLCSGEPTRLMDPVELPLVPVSCISTQLLRVCRPLVESAFEGTVAEAELSAASVTSIATSATHTAPLVLQVLTCTVWVPTVSETWVSRVVLP